MQVKMGEKKGPDRPRRTIRRWWSERLSLAQVALQFLAGRIEFTLGGRKFLAILTYARPIVADLLAVLHDLRLAGAVANIPAQLRAVVSQLSIVFAQVRPFLSYVSARSTDIPEVLPDFRLVVMTAVVPAAVMTPIVAAVTTPIVAVVTSEIVANIALVPIAAMKVAPIVLPTIESLAVIPVPAFVLPMVFMAVSGVCRYDRAG